MSRPVTSALARRGFLARLSAAASATALLGVSRRLDAAEPAPTPLNASDPDAWIDTLKGRHKVLLHVHKEARRGVEGAAGYLRDARDGYGIPEKDQGIAVLVHGPSIAMVLGEGLWKKYTLGSVYNVKDAAGNPATVSPYLVAAEGTSPEVLVPNLQARGVVFVVCNVALRNLAKRLAGGDASAVEARHQEVLAGLVPGVVPVPNGYVSLVNAQKRGMTYLYID
jgi:intracellular sulfur oxidation DsrE/DsrF family protein